MRSSSGPGYGTPSPAHLESSPGSAEYEHHHHHHHHQRHRRHGKADSPSRRRRTSSSFPSSASGWRGCTVRSPGSRAGCARGWTRCIGRSGGCIGERDVGCLGDCLGTRCGRVFVEQGSSLCIFTRPRRVIPGRPIVLYHTATNSRPTPDRKIVYRPSPRRPAPPRRRFH